MPKEPTPRQTIAALSVAVGAFASLQSLLVPVLPVMQVDLGTDTAGITWALTVWLITAAVTTPIIGRVGDMAGKRRTLIVSMVVVIVGCLVAALAPNLTLLLVGRVLQGFGGGMFPLAFGLVREGVPATRVPGAIGILAAITAVGSGLGTVLAGPLADLVGWRGLFVVPLAGLAVGVVLVRSMVKESTVRAPGRLNVPAALLLSAGLVAFLLPLSLGSSWGWGSPATIGSLILAAVLLTAWVLVELRSREPLIDMRMMRLPGVWNANVGTILIGAAMFGVWAYFARFLQVPTDTGYGLGLSVAQAGLVMLPMLILMALAGFAVGPLSRMLGARGQVIVGSLVAVGATVSIAAFHSDVWQLTAAATVFGFGVGLVLAALTTVVVQNVSAMQTGVATGVNANIRTVGSGIGVALMTAIITGSSGSGAGIGPATEQSYITGFLVMAGIGLAAAVVMMIGRRQASRTEETADHAQPVALEAATTD